MKKYSIFYALSILVLSGCASSYLKNSTNVSNTKKKYDKILVIAKSKDKTARITFENQVVNDLAAQGITAKSSIEVINSESFDKELTDNDLDNLRQSIIDDGYDGIIVTNLISAEQYTDVNQGNMNTAYVPVRYGRFGRYYRSYPVSYWGEDTVDTGMEYTLESCLYDLTMTAADNLQWVGRFKVKNPDDLIKTIEKYSTELTTELVSQSISK